jgi:hypothetical protein
VVVFLVLALLAWVFLVLGIDNGHVGVYHDDGIYLTAARALRDGQGYCLISRPGAPPPKYPMGLPLTIAAMLALVPGEPSLATEILVARLVATVSGLIFFVACYTWLRKLGSSRLTAGAIVLATAFHPAVLIGCGGAIFADLPFCALVYCVFLMLPDQSEEEARMRRLRSFTAGFLAGAAQIVRTNGVTLILGVMLHLAAGSRKPRGLSVALAALGCAAPLAVSWYVPMGESGRVPADNYQRELAAAWSTPHAGRDIIARNLQATTLELPFRVLASVATYIDPVVRGLKRHPAISWSLRGLCCGIVLMGLIGLYRGRCRDRMRVCWIHAMGSVAIFLVWPWTMILDRFFLSLYPLVWLAAWRGAERVEGILRFPQETSRPGRRPCSQFALILGVLATMAVTGRGLWVFHSAGGQWPGASDRRALADCLEELRWRLEPTAVVAARWPETVFLYTGRQAVPLTEDDQILLGCYDRSDRLLRWMEASASRPFYLLVRDGVEDPERSDRRQAEALGESPGIELQVSAALGGGRYRLLRVLAAEPRRPAAGAATESRPPLPLAKATNPS